MQGGKGGEQNDRPGADAGPRKPPLFDFLIGAGAGATPTPPAALTFLAAAGFAGAGAGAIPLLLLLLSTVGVAVVAARLLALPVLAAPSSRSRVAGPGAAAGPALPPLLARGAREGATTTTLTTGTAFDPALHCQITFQHTS